MCGHLIARMDRGAAGQIVRNCIANCEARWEVLVVYRLACFLARKDMIWTGST